MSADFHGVTCSLDDAAALALDLFQDVGFARERFRHVVPAPGTLCAQAFGYRQESRPCW